MPLSWGVHWRTPCVITATTLGGILSACGHHLFYNSLDQKAVPEGNYAFAGRTFSRQQSNLFVGTALAYFVKTFLCFAISAAYVQVFWRHFKASKQSPSLEELDWASSGLDNALRLFEITLGFKHPQFVLLAAVFW